MSPKKFTLTLPDCISTAKAFVVSVPETATVSSSREYPKLTKTRILPVSLLAHAVAPSTVAESQIIPLKSSRAIPTVVEEVAAFIPTPATELGEILSPILIGPFSKDTFVGTLPARATAGFFGSVL